MKSHRLGVMCACWNACKDQRTTFGSQFSALSRQSLSCFCHCALSSWLAGLGTSGGVSCLCSLLKQKCWDKNSSVPLLTFYTGTRDSNSGPQACTTSPFTWLPILPDSVILCLKEGLLQPKLASNLLFSENGLQLLTPIPASSQVLR